MHLETPTHTYPAPHKAITPLAKDNDPLSAQAHREEKTIRFVDLCAGIGGFHHALCLVEQAIAQNTNLSNRYHFECVLACEVDPLLRELYLDNFKNISESYSKHYPFPSARAVEMDIYDHDGNLNKIHGDIAELLDLEAKTIKKWPDSSQPIIPAHDILCAGFPCQPFSKSGGQKGFDDTRGTVFGLLSIIIKELLPAMVLLENVGNFERHDNGNTWTRVRGILEELGYNVDATTHVTSNKNSSGLLSPHHLGLPHHRERFFIVASLAHKANELGLYPNSTPFPPRHRASGTSKKFFIQNEISAENELLKILIDGEEKSSEIDINNAKLPESRINCIDHWNKLLQKIDLHNINSKDPLNRIGSIPSFPIWGFELDPWHWYPIDSNPSLLVNDTNSLRIHWEKRYFCACKLLPPPQERSTFLGDLEVSDAALTNWVQLWPAYAKKRESWPSWKIRFIEQNRSWAKLLIKYLDREWLRSWLDDLSLFSPSLQKLEWNCKGERLDLYEHILQFRPSGLRVKRLRHVPALVAMTTTQIPIVPIQSKSIRDKHLGAKARYLTTHEALLLQGFPPDWTIPTHKESAYKAFGNAVHAGLVKEVLLNWLFSSRGANNAVQQPTLISHEW